MKILQVNTHDVPGGAERIAMDLHRGFVRRGHQATLAVGRRNGPPEPGVVEIPNDAARRPWARTWIEAARQLAPALSGVPGSKRLCQIIGTWTAEPARTWHRRIGHEDFEFPGFLKLLESRNISADVLQLHNLHGNFFDLRVLPQLSTRFPTFITLHDAWLLSGHCSHSLGCDRWMSGCGSCPDLTLYPAVRRDATAANWKRKKAIAEKSQLYVITPCQWLLKRARQSLLLPGIVDAQVIPNGVDTQLFRPPTPERKKSLRKMLELHPDDIIFLFCGTMLRSNPWKDHTMLQEAFRALANNPKVPSFTIVALGDDGPTEIVGRGRLRPVAFQADREIVVNWYQAADIYLHPARIDTFPTTILEAMAVGLPTIGTAVGGIPEQIISPAMSQTPTGLLCEKGNVAEFIGGMEHLMRRPDVRYQMSCTANIVGVSKYAMERQLHDYLAFYESVGTRAERGEPHHSN